MSNEVSISRTTSFEVSIPGEKAVVFIHTDDSGGFLKAIDGKGKPIAAKKGKKESGIAPGTIKVIQNSPWCIIYYDPYYGWVKICSPGARC